MSQRPPRRRPRRASGAVRESRPQAVRVRVVRLSLGLNGAEHARPAGRPAGEAITRIDIFFTRYIHLAYSLIKGRSNEQEM